MIYYQQYNHVRRDAVVSNSHGVGSRGEGECFW